MGKGQAEAHGCHPAIHPWCQADSSRHSWSQLRAGPGDWGTAAVCQPCSLLLRGERLTLSVKNAESSSPHLGEKAASSEWISCLCYVNTLESDTLPRVTAPHLHSCQQRGRALCAPAAPALLPPAAPDTFPSRTTDFSWWGDTRANRHFHTLCLSPKGHRLQARPLQLHQSPVVPPAHLQLKNMPLNTRGWYFCLSCFETHRPLNKLQETIKSEKVVSN